MWRLLGLFCFIFLCKAGNGALNTTKIIREKHKFSKEIVLTLSLKEKTVEEYDVQVPCRSTWFKIFLYDSSGTLNSHIEIYNKKRGNVFCNGAGKKLWWGGTKTDFVFSEPAKCSGNFIHFNIVKSNNSIEIHNNDNRVYNQIFGEDDGSCNKNSTKLSTQVFTSNADLYISEGNTTLLKLRGSLKGHTGQVTQIATTQHNSTDMIVSASKDKTIIEWKLTKESGKYGSIKRTLKGHSDVVSDLVLSSDGLFALSGSLDSNMTLWDLNTGGIIRNFTGHTNGILSVDFSLDNRHIVSGSKDKTIKLWDTQGNCMNTMQDSDWVSCVRFHPNYNKKIVVSAGRDKKVKMWNLDNCGDNYCLSNITNHTEHTDYINAVTISPDGGLAFSGGKDGKIMLWDLKNHKLEYTLDCGEEIRALAFSPTRYWLCVATDSKIKIWGLVEKQIVYDKTLSCTSLAWSSDGLTLFAGCTNNEIYVWEVAAK